LHQGADLVEVRVDRRDDLVGERQAGDLALLDALHQDDPGRQVALADVGLDVPLGH
jgi:hypothetical protein